MALVVITGGARSGKSAAAENLAATRQAAGRPVVVAVFASRSDAEMADRIEKHQFDRPTEFQVVEAIDSQEWLTRVPDDAVLVVDCLGTCLGLAMLEAWEETSAANATFGDTAELPPGFETVFAARVRDLVTALAQRCGDAIVVTNETGSGVVPAYATGRLFRDELGRANAALIGIADAAFLAVAGRLIDVGSLPKDATWPED
jgi:adenosyl cobinamide kinase/adenosyl cobinamide phosphate guanylyltransferase